jgi:pimeloyl-ACP methyl ester carboxylesterase
MNLFHRLHSGRPAWAPAVNNQLMRLALTDVDLGAGWKQFRRDVVLRNRRIAYLDVGDHPRTCLLIHGFGASWQYWMYTIPKLTEAHRVTAVDLPGFGDSELQREQCIDAQLPIINEFCTALGIGPIDVVGHSMGTLVACEIAARYPQLVHSLVLTGGPIMSVIDLFRSPLRTIRKNPKVANFLIEALTAGLPLPASVEKLIASRTWARRLAFAPYVQHPEQLPRAAVTAILHGAGAPGALKTLRQGFGYDLRPALEKVRCPTLIIAGAADKLVPESDVRAFIDADPTNRRLHLLDDTGHIPMLEQPDRFNELIADFLTTTAQPMSPPERNSRLPVATPPGRNDDHEEPTDKH